MSHSRGHSSRSHRPFSRSTALPSLPERAAFARVLRDDWLSYGTSTDPADRDAAEAAVTELYRLVGAPVPEFVWVPSPTAAMSLVLADRDHFRPATPRSFAAPSRTADLSLTTEPSVAVRLASLVSGLRARMDRRIGRTGTRPARWAPTLPGAGVPDPDQALRHGTSLCTVLETTVHEPLAVSLRDALRAPLRTESLPADDDSPGLLWYGQHDAYWVATYDIHARVGTVVHRARDFHQLSLWAALARSTGWWWPGEGRCVLAERPAEVHTEPQPDGRHGEFRLHRDDGPAVRFRDGTGAHVLHGTLVPEWVVNEPTVERIHRERNVEVRRSAIERIGWDSYVERAGLSRVASAADPGNSGCDLRLYHVPGQFWGGRPGRVLLVVNGSVEPDGRRRRYGLSVPRWIDDPVAAAGWSYGLTGDQYARLVRRT